MMHVATWPAATKTVGFLVSRGRQGGRERESVCVRERERDDDNDNNDGDDGGC